MCNVIIIGNENGFSPKEIVNIVTGRKSFFGRDMRNFLNKTVFHEPHGYGYLIVYSVYNNFKPEKNFVGIEYFKSFSQKQLLKQFKKDVNSLKKSFEDQHLVIWLVVFHGRTATSGSHEEKYLHPLVFNNRYFMIHNGIISIPHKINSDTYNANVLVGALIDSGDENEALEVFKDYSGFKFFVVWDYPNCARIWIHDSSIWGYNLLRKNGKFLISKNILEGVAVGFYEWKVMPKMFMKVKEEKGYTYDYIKIYKGTKILKEDLEPEKEVEEIDSDEAEKAYWREYWLEYYDEKGWWEE